MNDSRNDLARTVFSVLIICALLLASFVIIWPFIASIVWAATIVIATWPVMQALERVFRGSRGLATTVMTLVLLGVVFVPLLMAVGTLVSSADEIVARIKSLETMQVPPPPDWVARIPLGGGHAKAAWEKLAGDGVKEVTSKVAPYASKVLVWLVSQLGGIGASLAQFLLTVVVAAVFYVNGDAASTRLLKLGRKLAGERGEAVVRLAGQSVRGVALGVVVTAIGQSVLAGIGLAVAGVPFAAALTVVMFVLCIAQLGLALVMLPAVGWLYYTGHPGWATALFVWSAIVGTLDNLVRPILIKKGADLPLLLIFTGVIGGLMTLGLIGIFVGPVILAVGHTLLDAWLNESEPAPPVEQPLDTLP